MSKGPKPPRAPNARARKFRNQETYEKLLSAYREAPADHQGAAALGSVSTSAARAAFMKGWPEVPGARPIQDVLAEEAERTRRKERELAQAELDAQKERARKGRAREDKIIDTAGDGVHAATLVVTRLTKSVFVLANQIEVSANAGKISDRDAMRFVSMYGLAAQRMAAAAHMMVQVSRLDRGMPTSITETAPPEMESAEEIRACQEILRGFERRHAERVEARKRGKEAKESNDAIH